MSDGISVMFNEGPQARSIVVPYFHGKQYQGPDASTSTLALRAFGGLTWWLCQLLFLCAAWGLLIAAAVLAARGYEKYRLISLIYIAWVVVYALCSQLNCGGYTRAPFYDLLQRYLPAGPRIARAAGSASPLYAPHRHLRTSLHQLLGNAALWALTLGLKLTFDYLVLVRPAAVRMEAILATDRLAIRVRDSPRGGGGGGGGEGATRIAVDVDPILAAVQAILLFLLSLIVTGVSYSLASGVWGCLQGMGQGIGSVRHWQHETLAASAPLWNALVSSLRTRDLLSDREARNMSFRPLPSLNPSVVLGETRWTAGGSGRRHGSRASSLQNRFRFPGRLSLGWPQSQPSHVPDEAAESRTGGGSPAAKAGTIPRHISDAVASPHASASLDNYLPPLAVYVAQIPQMVSGSSPTSEQLQALEQAFVVLLSLLVKLGALEPPTELQRTASCCAVPRPDDESTTAVRASVASRVPETVMFALSSSDARAVLGAQLKGDIPPGEVLFTSDNYDSPSESRLLCYLLSEFPDEFSNLLERCDALPQAGSGRPRDKAAGEQPYNLRDFLPRGRLYEHRAQLLLWASFRCQTLARTVDGMSLYRSAIAIQAVTDALAARMAAAPVAASAAQGQQAADQSAGAAVIVDVDVEAGLGGQGTQAGLAYTGGGDYGGVGDGAGGYTPAHGVLKLSWEQAVQVREALRNPRCSSVEELVEALLGLLPELGPLLDRKYGTVVSSQVYASLVSSGALKQRWCGHGVSLLATRYPSLQVAYLEPVNTVKLITKPDYEHVLTWYDSALIRAVPLDTEVQHLQTAASGSGGGGGGAGGASDGDDGTAGGGGGGLAVSRSALWRRRHTLLDLKAAPMEVIFRLRMPVNLSGDARAGVILGEGKPENQNSAVPYCTGVLLQAIDMNQDNTLAQAFKLRNITLEFEPPGPPSRPGGPSEQHVAIVSYPEWIFSYRCGLLADLAAATERTFGTQIQRVMDRPSAVKSHYGHPDLWNRLFAMTRAGVSKPNATQHVSEDAFGGYNALKRGGLSRYAAYMSVGKGRDMGLDSILGFEAKISKGCAEQLLSRDVRHLGTHMDFFRCLSFYATGPGHFVNNWLTVLTIRGGLWVQLLLLLGGVSRSSGSIASAIGGVQILQLGTLPLLAYLFVVWLESGLAVALSTILRHTVAGGLLFHIFRSTTSAASLESAMLWGGAAYVGTGRGFSLERKTFTQVPRYRLWSALTVLLPQAATAILSALLAVSAARFDTRRLPDLVWVLGGSVASWAALAAWAMAKRQYTASGLRQGWRWSRGAVQVAAIAALGFVGLFVLFMPKRGMRFSGVLITLYANQQVASLALSVAAMCMPGCMWARRLSDAAYRQLDSALGQALAVVLVGVCFIWEIGLVMLGRVLRGVGQGGSGAEAAVGGRDGGSSGGGGARGGAAGGAGGGRARRH
ncbi:hypothetical protein GPECTOR_163g143 [Gonium pectorale]|uniref:Glycosyl transferase 48 domain-containing protein n=1 Tax=Gonium pectorale TaxID=33097 RepID=A0A150FYN5_GONPE|nr:hypothetical protein GPECTOR_163g143 [Gonium pectorale]|eukprot:KXZ42315.1 hypothetical protein GPECTOR_163g143 [Gonium pectorale]